MKGAREEDLAFAHLRAQGLKPLLRNVRVPGGELDLVMRAPDALVIVEVRKRAHRGFGTAAESVDARKQSRIVRSTQWLLARHPEWNDLPVRFDVVTFDADDSIEWLKAAFDAA